MFELIARGASILDRFVRTVPLDAERKIPPESVGKIFETLGDLDQKTRLGVAMAGLQRTYEMQIQGLMVEELQRAYHGVEKDLEDERHADAEVREEAAAAQDELQSVLRETGEALDSAHGDRDPALIQYDSLQKSSWNCARLLRRSFVSRAGALCLTPCALVCLPRLCGSLDLVNVSAGKDAIIG
jgi:hypothetical protein